VIALAAMASLVSPAVLQSQSAAPAPPPILLGTAWYPEQWPESGWDRDLTLMQQAEIHMVRVGEFAWSRMEQQSIVLPVYGRAVLSVERQP
jgi:beta-galactosidase